MRLSVRMLWMFVPLLLAGPSFGDDGAMAVEGAWIREAPPSAHALAGYMTLVNHSAQARVLMGAGSGAFGGVMMHRTVMEGGVAKMVHQHSVEVPAHGRVVFEPNGYHLMLMKPKSRLKSGDEVEVDLRFKDGLVLPVHFQVRAEGPDSGAMEHHHH